MGRKVFDAENDPIISGRLLQGWIREDAAEKENVRSGIDSGIQQMKEVSQLNKQYQ